MRKAAWPDITISPQVLQSCSTKDDGCHGGEPIFAFEYMHYNNITDATCSAYQSVGHENGMGCSPSRICKTCEPGMPCFVPDSYPIYSVEEYAHFPGGEEAMMQEIF